MTGPAAEKPAPGVARRRWRVRALIAMSLLLLTIGAGIAVRQTTPLDPFETATVHRGDVIATLEAEGNVNSAHNLEISCRVDGGSTILWIVPDGSQVHAGDELVRFDSSAVEDLLSQQTIVVERARAAQISAEHELSAARLALPEYVEGTYVSLNKEADAAIATADYNRRLARQTLSSAKRLVRLGYITPVQLNANVFGLEQAELQFEIARRAKSVLEAYNRPKMTQDLKSRLETAAAMVRSATAEFELAQMQLARYHKQLEHCVVRAPQDGLAIYANDTRRSSSETPPIELGAFVRQRQNVLWLPDLSQMEVKALVHESSVLRVRPGQRAAVRIRGRELPATITEIANQPARTKRSQQHLKYFLVSALVDEPSPGLRPGETADLTLLLDYRPDVLRAPLETVVVQDEGTFVWVDRDGAVEPRRIELGAHGDAMAEVRRGLSPGEHLVLHPREALPGLAEPREDQSEHRQHRFEKALPISTASRSQISASGAAGG
jgi:HlyD family secretion protein